MLYETPTVSSVPSPLCKRLEPVGSISAALLCLVYPSRNGGESQAQFPDSGWQSSLVGEERDQD